MNNRFRTLLAALTLATLATACAPNEAEIGTTVKKNLMADEMVKAAQIDVGVKNNIVTLTGMVETSAIKERASEIARKTSGVSEVVDQLALHSSFERGATHRSGAGPGHGGAMMGGSPHGQENRPASTDDKRQ